MLKSKSRLASPKGLTRAKPSRSKNKGVQLTLEQKARLAALEQFAREKQEHWDSLSESEKKAEDESWDRIMKRMNEDRKGYRQLFVDP